MDKYMKYAKWWLPIVLMIILAPFTPYLDLNISRYFYEKGNGQFTSNAFYDFMFSYGVIPAEIVTIAAILLLFLSYFFSKLRKWRDPSLVFILTLILGGGLISHVILKDHWGRPRPKQVIEFGGTQQYRPFYDPNIFNQPQPSKSFPCGHCTMGFIFFALILVGKRLDNRAIYISGIVLSILLGGALGLTRIAQGGHFFSDVLMTALIMWLTALASEWLVYGQRD